MMDMEGRDTANTDMETEAELLAARHRLETRQDWAEGGGEGEGVDENGNPVTRSGHIHPIMSNSVRPVSIYRHTPVFRPQKLTVPHTVHNNSATAATAANPGNYGSTAAREQMAETDRGKEDSKRKRKKKKEEEKNVVKAEYIEGYRGNKDIDSLLEFIGEGEESKKKSKKSSDKLADKNTKKVTTKSDTVKDDQKVRKKKEKSQEKDLVKPSVTKKLSTDTIDNDIIEEPEEGVEDEKRSNSEEAETSSVRQSISPEKESAPSPGPAPAPAPAILDSVKTVPVSAPSSNDSGHVSAGPCSLPSISSTKELSIASSPPLDLDPSEFSEEAYEELAELGGDMVTSSEFTKVTKKQRKKKKRSVMGSVYPPGSHEAAVLASSNQGPEAEQFGGYSFRGYRAMRGSREAVSGTKSTCSVPPSEASDTDDHDSVHSLPVGSTRTKVSVSVASVSSGHTPHASYADIARHAAALQTQQQGQQQHAVYREQLQFSRENTPGNTKESVSSNEDYFYNPDLDASFPPVQASVPPVQEQETEHNSSHDNRNNNTSNNNQHNVASSNNNA